MHHKCGICCKTFSTPSRRKLHMMTHTGEKPHECDVCNKTFHGGAAVYNMETHKKINHEGLKEIVCDICKMNFGRRTHLYLHVKKFHNPLNLSQPQCDLCEKTFNDYGELYSHWKLEHPDSKIHRCKYCYKTFESQNKAHRHMYRVHNEMIDTKSIKCDI